MDLGKAIELPDEINNHPISMVESVEGAAQWWINHAPPRIIYEGMVVYCKELLFAKEEEDGA